MRNSGEAGLVQITHKKTEPALGCQLLISVSQEEFGGPTISRPNYLNGRRQYLNLPPHTLSRTPQYPHPAIFLCLQPAPSKSFHVCNGYECTGKLGKMLSLPRNS